VVYFIAKSLPRRIRLSGIAKSGLDLFSTAKIERKSHMMLHSCQMIFLAGQRIIVRRRNRYMAGTAIGALLLLGLYPVTVFCQTDFYSGKTITIIQDSSPGGVGHLRTNAVVAGLKKHIPGNPNIVIQFMEGAGGRKAANHLFNNVRPDGMTIGRVGSGFVSSPILGLPGVLYDLNKFVYLGSGHSEGSTLFFTRQQVGLDNLDKLKRSAGLRIGGQSIGHPNYIAARLFAWLLDLREPRFVVGYSGAEMDVALAQGELDARANSVDAVLQRTPQFINDGLMHFHGVVEVPLGFRLKHAVLASLPALHDLAKTEGEKRVVQMYVSFMQFLQAFVLPPGTPPDRVKTLQDAFAKVWKDQEFHENWKKMTKGEASPLMPEELEAMVKAIPRDPQDVKLYNLIAGEAPLPKR
jgi:tripartite-type tricarboxylate transporter receptor subunit TctC